jgi:ferredoxin-NADP reductase
MPLLPPKAYTARLTDKLQYNPRYTQFRFELIDRPNRLEFRAGQYVSIQVSPNGERRSYSICSTPEITHGFEILVDVLPQGVGSKYLQSLDFGDKISFLGPLGRFLLTPETINQSRSVVLIATGSGVAPFKSMLHELLRKNTNYSLISDSNIHQESNQKSPDSAQNITLHWGMRYSEDLFWLEEMQDFMSSFSNFHFNPILSRPNSDWPLSRGRVTAVLQASTLDQSADYYLCGSQEMITAVKAILINNKIDLTQIHHESFY